MHLRTSAVCGHAVCGVSEANESGWLQMRICTLFVGHWGVERPEPRGVGDADARKRLSSPEVDLVLRLKAFHPLISCSLQSQYHYSDPQHQIRCYACVPLVPTAGRRHQLLRGSTHEPKALTLDLNPMTPKAQQAKSLNWVAAKPFTSSYYGKKLPSFTTYPYYRNFK